MFTAYHLWSDLLIRVAMETSKPWEIIWMVGNGMKPSLVNLSESRDVKEILVTCWTFKNDHRPDFTYLSNSLKTIPKKRLARSPSHPAIKQQAWNTFSHKSASQVFQYISFPIITINKLPKAQVTKGIQSPSHPRYTKSKFTKLPKVQVTQSPSHPKPKFPKVQVTQGVQSPSHPRCSKSKLSKLLKVQVALSPNYPKPKLPEVQVAPK